MTGLLGTVAAFAFALVAGAATTTPIANSKHNMKNAFGAGTIIDDQVCLPCHTPHKPVIADVLWNHKLSTVTYQLYNTAHSTRYSATNYLADIDMESKMCLSCHDGTVAVDAYGSHPGTASKTIGADSTTAGYVIGAGGDLTMDHPIGVRYPGYTSGTSAYDATKGRGYIDPATWSTATFANGEKAVGGGAVKLFKEKDTDTVATVVSCASCHTPHSNKYNFLRIRNTNSQLCLLCHDK
jgi:predicted CXXCH cytochrome family protein